MKRTLLPLLTLLLLPVLYEWLETRTAASTEETPS